MDKDQRRRTDLVSRLADHVLAAGLGTASLRPLAAAVGTSDRMLLYYFPDKAALVGAILEEVAARMTALLDANTGVSRLSAAELEPLLLGLVLADDAWPFMRLWLEIASLAARADPVAAPIGQAIARGFLAWAAVQLDTPPEEAEKAATRLMMKVEGAVLLKALGLGKEVAAVLG